jgi:hypothetical protein
MSIDLIKCRPYVAKRGDSRAIALLAAALRKVLQKASFSWVGNRGKLGSGKVRLRMFPERYEMFR